GASGAARHVRSLSLCFFFQAEDGIRDFHVTGVQTCALPISPLQTAAPPAAQVAAAPASTAPREVLAADPAVLGQLQSAPPVAPQIGRASCRERVETAVLGRAVYKKTGEGDDGSSQTAAADLA